MLHDTYTWLAGGDGKSKSPGTAPSSDTIQLAGVRGSTPSIFWGASRRKLQIIRPDILG